VRCSRNTTIRIALRTLAVLLAVGLVAGLAVFVTYDTAGIHLAAALTCSSLFLLAMLVAATETAVAAVRRPRLQLLLEAGSADAASVQRLLENSTGFVATAQFVITAAIAGGATVLVADVGPTLSAMLGSRGWAYALLAFAVLAIAVVLVQQVARSLGLRHAEAIALSMAGLARVGVTVLSPVVAFLEWCGRIVYRHPGTTGRDTAGGVTEAGIILQVDVAEEEGVLEQNEGEMIRSIFEFGDTVAREIMVPRIDIEACDASTPVGEAADQAIAAGHSRVPVYEETIDRVEGVFYVKDALRFLREGRLDVRVQEVMRPAYFVPETKKVDDLLREMQQRRVHLAIVVDEYGGTAGLVTIEDILEEIVGEIQDEFDAEEAPVVQISEDEAVIDALMTLDDVNDILSTQLDAEDVDTLGGYVYAKLGRVPAKGDEIASEGVRLIVEQIEGNRINKVRIIKLVEPNSRSVPPTPDAKEASQPAAVRRDAEPDEKRGSA
jgi:CBS domain containing-hemolysin-like protein